MQSERSFQILYENSKSCYKNKLNKIYSIALIKEIAKFSPATFEIMVWKRIYITLISLILLAGVFLQRIEAKESLSFSLQGLEDVKIRRFHETTLGDSYRNYQFLSYNASIRPFLPNRGLGFFANVSYANLFLEVSLDQSLFLLVSDKCVNCKYRLYNSSHSVTSYIYSYESDECWSNLFSMENNSVSECFGSFRYYGNDIYGKLGYESLYFSSEMSVITITSMVFVTYQQGEFFPENVQGIFGLGNSDIEGTFGHSLMENFLDNDAISAPHVLVCVNSLGRGYLKLGLSLNSDQGVLWTKQRNPFYYSFDVSEITLGDLSIKRAMQGAISFSTAYLKLSPALFNQVKDKIVNLVSSSSGNEALVNKMKDFVDRMMTYNSRAILTVAELTFLQQIETPVFTIVGGKHKKVELKIARMFGICEDVVQNYETERFKSFNDTTELEVCIWIANNTENDMDIIFGNLINSENGTLYFLDKERGRMGFIKEYDCNNDNQEYHITLNIFSVYIVEKMVAIIALAVLVIASLNKCDEYFYEEMDNPEEGLSTMNLSQNPRTTNANANTNNHGPAYTEGVRRRRMTSQLDDSGLGNVSPEHLG